MKVVYRRSDGMVTSLHADDADMTRVGVGPDEDLAEVPESAGDFRRRVGNRIGRMFLEGTSVVVHPPEEKPATLAGEIRRARMTDGTRLEIPVSLRELEAAENALKGRGVG